MKYLRSCLFLAVAVCSGCVTNGEVKDTREQVTEETVFSDSRGLQQLTSVELQRTLDGNTLRWGDGTQVFYNGSEIRALKADGSPLIGAINFANNLHCRSWNGGRNKCSSVYDDGSGTLFFFVNGSPDTSGGSASILAGNPKQL